MTTINALELAKLHQSQLAAELTDHRRRRSTKRPRLSFRPQARPATAGANA